MEGAVLSNVASQLTRPGSMFQAFPEALEHFLRDRRLVTLYMKSMARFVAAPLLRLTPADIVQVLRDIGRIDDGLEWAAAEGRVAIVRLLLLQDGSVLRRATHGVALLRAARNGHAAIVALLLDHGADFRAMIHVDKESAMQWAAFAGHTETVALLLDRGADIHACDDAALENSAMDGHTETVRLLLDRGADIHSGQDQALQCAAWKGHTETVALLLDHGADIHAQSDFALINAAYHGHTETVRLLLDRGADIHAVDDFALRFAAENGHMKTVRLLLDRGARNDKAFMEATRNGHTEIADLLRKRELE